MNLQKYLPKIIAALVIIYSAIVIYGWINGIDSLTRVLPNQINMKFPTAFCFFLSGFTLFSLDNYSRGKKDWPQVLIPAYTMLILLIMATLLAAGLIGVSTGMESLFVQDTLGTAGTVVPGLPSIPTMISFIAFSLICLIKIMELPKSKLVLDFFSLIITLIGLSGTLGYLLNIPDLYFKFNPSLTPIALNTAFLFLLLGVNSYLIRANNTSNNK